jgi:hypothetical protein
MLKAVYRAVAGASIAFAVVMQYALLLGYETSADAWTASVRFFSFFTILTNVLAALALLVPVLAPRSRLGAFLSRPSVRTAIAGYIIMVATIYYLLLRDVSRRQGWPLFFEHVLHYVTPPLFVLDWLLFVPKRAVSWRVGLASLGFPLAYVAWTLAHGAVTGWYPYPFADVTDLGYARVLANIAALIVAYVALVTALVAIGRRIGPAD